MLHPNETYEFSLRNLLGMPLNSMGGLRNRKGSFASPFHDIEVDLYKQFVEQRKNGRKVSASWIRITTRKIYNEKKANNPEKWES